MSAASAMVGLSHHRSSFSPVSVSPRRSAKNSAGEGSSASVVTNMTQEGFQVCKKFLHPAQIVDDAARGFIGLASALTAAGRAIGGG